MPYKKADEDITFYFCWRGAPVRVRSKYRRVSDAHAFKVSEVPSLPLVLLPGFFFNSSSSSSIPALGRHVHAEG